MAIEDKNISGYQPVRQDDGQEKVAQESKEAGRKWYTLGPKARMASKGSLIGLTLLLTLFAPQTIIFTAAVLLLTANSLRQDYNAYKTAATKADKVSREVFMPKAEVNVQNVIGEIYLTHQEIQNLNKIPEANFMFKAGKKKSENPDVESFDRIRALDKPCEGSARMVESVVWALGEREDVTSFKVTPDEDIMLTIFSSRGREEFTDIDLKEVLERHKPKASEPLKAVSVFSSASSSRDDVSSVSSGVDYTDLHSRIDEIERKLHLRGLSNDELLDILDGDGSLEERDPDSIGSGEEENR